VPHTRLPRHTDRLNRCGWGTGVLVIGVLAGLLGWSGCGPGPTDPRPLPRGVSALDPCGRFAPVWIRFVGLTGFEPGGDSDAAQVRAYVDVLDAFDCRIKAPGTFRFELYEYVPRSSNPRGRRVHLWGDIDLTDAAANNAYWRDFLRCYQFELPLSNVPAAGTYVLEVTCRTIQGTRLSATVQLAYPPP